MVIRTGFLTFFIVALVLASLSASSASASSESRFSVGYNFENYGPAKTHQVSMMGSGFDFANGWTSSDRWSWHLALATTRVKFTPLVMGVGELEERQSFFNAGFSYLLPGDRWSFGFDYRGGRSVEEQLSYHGPKGFIQYVFADRWSASLDVASFQFMKKFEGDGGRVFKSGKPLEGEESRRQNFFEFGVSWQMEKWMQFSLSATRYSYSSEMRDFLRFLDIYHESTNLLVGLQNPLSAFNDRKLHFTTSMTVDEWLITYELNRFVALLEDAVTLSHTLALKHDLDLSGLFGEFGSRGFRGFGGAGLATVDRQLHAGAKGVNFWFLGLSKSF